MISNRYAKPYVDFHLQRQQADQTYQPSYFDFFVAPALLGSLLGGGRKATPSYWDTDLGQRELQRRKPAADLDAALLKPSKIFWYQPYVTKRK